ncbi:hypothetical protein V8E36_004500 [Tilletia maclaganii]
MSQASSARGWTLDDVQVQVAARISLANASSTTDARARREQAILAAHNGDAKLPTQPGLLHAEVDAIRAVLQDQAEHATIAGRTSMRRAAPSLSEDAQPAAKRPRPGPEASHRAEAIDMETNASSAGSGSAVERFFGVAELISLVCEHLAYDCIDLSSLSKVSKRCRSIALPVLVTSLNIPISEAKTSSDLFDSNPGLVAHVKYLRLWDDVATDDIEHPDYIDIRLDEGDWAQFGRLLAHFNVPTPSSQPTPLVNLVAGQTHLFEIYTQFLNAPHLLGRVVSLQLIDDARTSTLHDDNPEEYRKEAAALSDLGSQITESLTLLLHACFKEQAGTAVTLHNFALEGFPRWSDEEMEPTLPAIGPYLQQKLASSLKQLSLNIAVGPGDLRFVHNLLGRQWSRLETVDLCLSDSSDGSGMLSDKIRDLVGNNPSIHHIRASVLNDTRRGAREWYGLAQPDQIQTLHHEDPDDAEELTAEAYGRLKALQDLRLSAWENATVLIENTDILHTLRVLRAPLEAVRIILEHKHQLREVHISPGSAASSMLEELNPSTLASTVTFLSMNIADLRDPIECLRSFPNLVELALVCPSGPAQAATVWSLEAILAILAGVELHALDQTSKLRALIVRTHSEAPLPLSESGDVAADVSLPRRLQYSTWLTGESSVEHFRVVRGADSTGPTACLQRLPECFRPKVDRETGVWEDDLNPQFDYALFDHLSGDEPRLKYA